MSTETPNLPALIDRNTLPALVTATASAQGYIAASIAGNTKRAYTSQWEGFAAWCESAGVAAMPAAPETVAAYLAHLAQIGRKASTIDSARAAIRKYHEVAGLNDCTAHIRVTQTLKGIRRERGTAPAQKAPVLTADLRRMLSRLPDSLKGQRDKALLLVGFATACRRSELVAITTDDIQETAEGLLITIRKSKTDQEGKGITKGITRGDNPDTCPVSALLEWLHAAGITSGPVFRSITKGGKVGERMTGQSVALVVKAAAKKAKLPKEKYSGHSLRAGMVTQAAQNGASAFDIMRQTGHTSVETVNKYIRKANVFVDNASARLGL